MNSQKSALEILSELVALKKMSKDPTKQQEYSKRKDKAWAEAFELLADEERLFYERHNTNLGGVYLVITHRPNMPDFFAIFSSTESVKSYLQQIGGSSVIAPFVVDEPNWGNTPCH